MSRRRINVTLTLGVIMYQSIDSGKIKFKLNNLIIKRGLSKNKLSVISGVRFDTIQRLCSGNLSRLDLEILCRLCKSLNCSIDELIEYEK